MDVCLCMAELGCLELKNCSRCNRDIIEKVSNLCFLICVYLSYLEMI